MELTERNITRYTIDGNTVPPTDQRRWRPERLVNIERRGPGLGSDQWRITRFSGELIYNLRTGEWEGDYSYRHTEDRSPYLTGLDEAAQLAQVLALRGDG